MTGPGDHRPQPEIPSSLLSRRWHGSLEAITDSERRPLRPIGATAREVAAMTSELLTELLSMPSVRIFAGVRPGMAELPRISHAIMGGSRLCLIESVAWPPGQYVTTRPGGVHCDGVYIGQSVAPLLAAVRHWRALLPHGHRVKAVVIVYPTGLGDLSLPAPDSAGLAWTSSADAITDLKALLPAGRPPISVRAVAALLAAIAPGDEREQRADGPAGGQVQEVG